MNKNIKIINHTVEIANKYLSNRINFYVDSDDENIFHLENNDEHFYVSKFWNVSHDKEMVTISKNPIHSVDEIFDADVHFVEDGVRYILASIFNITSYARYDFYLDCIKNNLH